MAEEPNTIVLAVLSSREERAALKEIFGSSPWALHTVGTFAEALQAFHASSIAVVISESRMPCGQSWIDLLGAMQEMTNPPPLIVADRLADERLWAEVLNLGGHDLLAKPFDPKEVLYAVGMACRCSENQQQIALRQQAKRAESSSTGIAQTRAMHSRRE